MFTRISNAFGRVIDAVNSVADNLFALSHTFSQANAAVRQRLELEALPAPAPEQTLLLTAQTDAQAPAVEPEPVVKNGRRKTPASA